MIFEEQCGAVTWKQQWAAGKGGYWLCGSYLISEKSSHQVGKINEGPRSMD